MFLLDPLNVRTPRSGFSHLTPSLDSARSALPDVEMCEDAYAACRDADVLVLVTEWNQFRMLDLSRVKDLLKKPVIVDLRNVYDPEQMRQKGFVYVSVGR